MNAFQKATPGSKEFSLRLVELVAVACHQIGAYLFELDDGIHKHEVHQSWQARGLKGEEAGRAVSSSFYPDTAFFHTSYLDKEQYPRGVADVVGYWAEGRIFGGVVVFDRGESEQEVGYHVHFLSPPGGGPRIIFRGIFDFHPRPPHTLSTANFNPSPPFCLSATRCGCMESSPQAREPCIRPRQSSSKT